MNARTILMLVAALSLAGCSSTTLVVSGGNSSRASTTRTTTARTAGPSNSARTLGIPPGQLPPPGMCRIWYPGRPPGHQPRAGRCETLAGQVPPGAWLISREGSRDRVRVTEYDRTRPGVRVAVRVYAASDGRMLAGD